MATWAEFAKAEPDLAAFARQRMQGRIVYQATIRLDGGPRVHPVSPWYGLVHYVCSIEEAVAKEYTDEETPVYRRWKPSSGDAGG